MSIEEEISNGDQVISSIDTLNDSTKKTLNKVFIRLLAFMNETEDERLLSSNRKLRVSLKIGFNDFLVISSKQIVGWKDEAWIGIFYYSDRGLWTIKAFANPVFNMSIMDYAIEMQDILKRVNDTLIARLDDIKQKSEMMKILNDM
jgi:hypothetical protein